MHESGARRAAERIVQRVLTQWIGRQIARPAQRIGRANPAGDQRLMADRRREWGRSGVVHRHREHVLAESHLVAIAEFDLLVARHAFGGAVHVHAVGAEIGQQVAPGSGGNDAMGLRELTLRISQHPVIAGGTADR